LRQHTTSDILPRSGRATEGATTLLTEYPDLAIILDAWPKLPIDIRAAVIASVKAGGV
jgi:hypothetical protein